MLGCCYCKYTISFYHRCRLKHILLTLAILVFLNHFASASTTNFKFTDTTGKVQQLSDYKGKWVLVNFWAPWCPRCKMEFPLLNDMDARSDVVVIGVGMDFGADPNSVNSTVERFNIRFPTIVGTNRRDPSSPALQVGPVDYYPTSYLYDPSGKIVMFIPGIISKTKLSEFMRQHNP